MCCSQKPKTQRRRQSLTLTPWTSTTLSPPPTPRRVALSEDEADLAVELAALRAGEMRKQRLRLTAEVG
jgi:hypothetical protein